MSSPKTGGIPADIQWPVIDSRGRTRLPLPTERADLGNQHPPFTRSTNPVGRRTRARSVALAIAHDSTWLATVSRAQIQIWNAHTGACAAAMRTEKALSACSWEPVGYTLIVAGEAGLYRFEFKPPTP